MNVDDISFICFTNATRLRKIFDYSNGGGLFDAFDNVPWGSDIDPVYIDALYLGAHSGFKRPSAFLIDYLSKDASDRVYITAENKERLAQIIQTRYNKKWNELWTAFMQDYVPFRDYQENTESSDNNAEVHTGTDTVDKINSRTVDDIASNTRSHKQGGTDSVEYTGTEKEDIKGSEIDTQTGVEIISKTGKQKDETSGSEITSVWGLGATNESDAQKSEIVTPTKAITTTFGFDNAPVTERHQYGEQDNDRESIHFYNDRYNEKSFDERKDTRTLNLTDSDAQSTTAKSTDRGEGTEKTTYNSATTETRKGKTYKYGYRESMAKSLRDYINGWRDDFFNQVFKDIDALIALRVY